MSVHIAQAVSDVVLDAQSLGLDGAVPVPSGSDIAAHIVQHAKADTLVSVITKPDTLAVAQLAAGLLRVPTGAGVVVHVALAEGVDGTPLVSAAPYVLYSTTPVLAHDHALLASRLAWSAQTLVVHLYTPGDDLDVDAEHVRHMVRAERRMGSPADDVDSAFFKSYNTAAAETLAAVRRVQVPLAISGPDHAQTVVVTTGAAPVLSAALGAREHIRIVEVSLLRPVNSSKLATVIPANANRVIVLDPPGQRSTKWSPLYLDIAETLQSRENVPTLLSGTLAQLDESSAHSFLDSLDSFQDGTVVGALTPPAELAPPHIPKHESSYTKVLESVFGDRFVVANDPQLVTTKGPAATRPEFALGTVQAQLDARARLVGAVQSLLSAGSKAGISPELHTALAEWSLKRDEAKASSKAGATLLELLKAENVQHPAADEILSLADHLNLPSRWIIGSDA
ncbi:hypothetical protein FRC09_014362, partial [Ceratobasidium sp. 395]